MEDESLMTIQTTEDRRANAEVLRLTRPTERSVTDCSDKRRLMEDEVIEI